MTDYKQKMKDLHNYVARLMVDACLLHEHYTQSVLQEIVKTIEDYFHQEDEEVTR